FRVGDGRKKGVVAVIPGQPNAGKPTLLNRPRKEERAIARDSAGTTRDTVVEAMNIKGSDVRLIDTPGSREAQDQIEEIGVRKTMEKIGQASLLLYVFDVDQTSATDVTQDLKKLENENLRLVVIANKMDLNPYAKAEEFVSPWLRHDQF